MNTCLRVDYLHVLVCYIASLVPSLSPFQCYGGNRLGTRLLYIAIAQYSKLAINCHRLLIFIPD